MWPEISRNLTNKILNYAFSKNISYFPVPAFIFANSNKSKLTRRWVWSGTTHTGCAHHSAALGSHLEGCAHSPCTASCCSGPCLCLQRLRRDLRQWKTVIILLIPDLLLVNWSVELKLNLISIWVPFPDYDQLRTVIWAEVQEAFKCLIAGFSTKVREA